MIKKRITFQTPFDGCYYEVSQLDDDQLKIMRVDEQGTQSHMQISLPAISKIGVDLIVRPLADSFIAGLLGDHVK
jgi:hypothetical protein